MLYACVFKQTRFSQFRFKIAGVLIRRAFATQFETILLFFFPFFVAFALNGRLLRELGAVAMNKMDGVGLAAWVCVCAWHQGVKGVKDVNSAN